MQTCVIIVPLYKEYQSDLEISEDVAKVLPARIIEFSYATNIGLYQPGNTLRGTSHKVSMVRGCGVRYVKFQEGWFYMVRAIY